MWWPLHEHETQHLAKLMGEHDMTSPKAIASSDLQRAGGLAGITTVWPDDWIEKPETTK